MPRQTYQSLVVPGDALLLVGVGVGVAVDGAGLAAKQAVQRRADLVAAVLLNGVALRAARLEEASTLLDVTYGESRQLAVPAGSMERRVLIILEQPVPLCSALKTVAHSLARDSVCAREMTQDCGR